MTTPPDLEGIAWLVYEYGNVMYELGRAHPSNSEYWQIQRRVSQRRIDEWMVAHGFDDMTIQPESERQ